MKILRAEFRNFRLLRDLDLDFAADDHRPLTVLRAANESGKTTILHALRWALYGDVALPNRGRGFRLQPIDWDGRKGASVPVSVTVDYEQTYHQPGGGGRLHSKRERFRLVRSVIEKVDGESARPESTIKLYQLGRRGAIPMESPNAVLHETVPAELRDVFFTDGDRALSFIEADAARATKRHRVQAAIRSLLGVGVIEGAINHVRVSRREINRKAKTIGSGQGLSEIVERLQAMEAERDRKSIELSDAEEQFRAFDERLSDVEQRLAEALRQGNRRELQTNIEGVKRTLAELQKQATAATKDHANLFRTRALATDIVRRRLVTVFRLLNELHDQGKIPNATIPVLEDRLSGGTCICGAALDHSDPKSPARRAHIQHLIDSSRRADEVQKVVTELYFNSKWLQPTGLSPSARWLPKYQEVLQRRDGIQQMQDAEGRKRRGLELELESVEDLDVQGLNETRRDYKRQRDRFLRKSVSIKAALSNLRASRVVLERDRDRLLKLERKGARILAERDVVHDVMEVLVGAYTTLTVDELEKVSRLMNHLFLEMIGSDPEQGSIIQHARISSDFDIIVLGPKERQLDPDRDLNGASRRALTLAFILALTKVSEVVAPNVIDTPLGMTSGFVKRSIMRTAIRESAQLILFLTHDEIVGCEHIIDESAGVVTTLTNPAHYPKILVNKPPSDVRQIIPCKCNHRSDCPICERRADAELDKGGREQ